LTEAKPLTIEKSIVFTILRDGILIKGEYSDQL
jgi:hypothetical protein